MEVVPPSLECAALLPENDHFTNSCAKDRSTDEHKMSYKINSSMAKEIDIPCDNRTFFLNHKLLLL